MRIGSWDLREEGREVITREVICKVVHLGVNIGWGGCETENVLQ